MQKNQFLNDLIEKHNSNLDVRNWVEKAPDFDGLFICYYPLDMEGFNKAISWFFSVEQYFLRCFCEEFKMYKMEPGNIFNEILLWLSDAPPGILSYNSSQQSNEKFRLWCDALCDSQEFRFRGSRKLHSDFAFFFERLSRRRDDFKSLGLPHGPVKAPESLIEPVKAPESLIEPVKAPESLIELVEAPKRVSKHAEEELDW